MKEKIKEAYEWLMAKIGSVEKDKLLHFTAGVIIAAAWAILLPSAKDYCLIPTLIVGLAKEGVDQALYNRGDGADLLATFLGGIFIWILALLA